MRTVLILLVWAVSACTSSSDQEEKNSQHVQSMFDAFNRHDWKAMSEHYADSALFLDPSFGIDYVRQSRNEMIAKYTQMEQLFPNVHDEVVTLFAKGDQVVVEFISTGSSGDSLSFTLPISCVLTLRNNLIVKDATYYNNCQ
jgi:ketosteroid isomerase-like protein